jgi:isopenicillin-N N-acyltransferase like protein
MFPVVETEGGARERGRQYGEAARERVARSVEAYAAVREEAERFRAPIVEFEPKYMEEIAGIAEGAGVDERDVLAMNVRTEIMFSAEARRLATPPPECSSFAVSSSRSGGALLIGQNWDWLEHAADTTVIVRARQDDGPTFLTVVEAGLLAKVGMNDAGLGIATNMLVSDSDAGGSGVPYHVLLRALHDAPGLPAALLALKRARRSSSANYMLAADDVAVDIEAFPGGHADMYLDYPEDGLLLHFNHFCAAEHRPHDLSMIVSPSSPFRQVRADELIRAAGGPLDRAFWERLLGDHSMFPDGICHHPEPEITNPPERAATVTAVLMEPGAGRMWIASGYPCEAAFEELEI